MDVLNFAIAMPNRQLGKVNEVNRKY